jgi:ribose transport system substrate-binding protein
MEVPMRSAIRWVSVLAAVVGLAAISACDRADAGKRDGGKDGALATGQTAPAKKVKIGVSIPAAEHGWTAGINWWAQRARTLYPDVEWTIATANNPEKQVADIEDMMVKGVDGLVILATESGPLTPIARQAHQRGIFIVNVDRGFLEPVAEIFLEGDNKSFGRTAAQFMVEKLGRRGDIVILEGMSSTVNTDRVQAAMEVFDQHPEIRVVGRQAGEWNRRKSLEAMQAMLTRHRRIDAVWAADDDMALGARQAIEEAGRQKEMWIFPGGGMKDVVKMVMENDPMIPANLTYSPSMIAAGMHMAVSVLRDGKRKQVMEFMPRHLMIDVELITPENAQRYYFPDSIY